MLVLAGDIGGTNSRLALYDLPSALDDGGPPAPRTVFERTYPSGGFPSLEAVIARFLADARAAAGDVRPARACVGVAGPVANGVSRVTNLPWVIEERTVEQVTGIGRVLLLNDFQAAALGVTAVGPEALVQIGGGPREPRGPVAVLGAGTGLGEAFLFWSPAAARYQVVSSEGGHVDFAPRSPLEAGLLQHLQARYGRVSCERVLSGSGIADIFGYLVSEPAIRPLVQPETLEAMKREEPTIVIVRHAVERRDVVCALAINLFSSVLGAVAGNLAVTFLATGGVYIAGGLGPRVRGYLENGTFRDAFEAKGRFQPFLSKIPVYLVEAEVGLLGAAVGATHL